MKLWDGTQFDLPRDRIISELDRLRTFASGATRGDFVELGHSAADLGHAEHVAAVIADRFGEAELMTCAAKAPDVAWALGRMYWEAASWSAFDTLSEAVGLPGHLPEDPTVARLVTRAKWRLTHHGGHWEELLGFCEDSLAAEARAPRSIALLADLSHLRGYCDYRSSGDIHASMKSVDAAVALYRITGESLNLCKSLVLQTAIRKSCGLLESASVSAREALAVAAQSLNPNLLQLALSQATTCAYRRGLLSEAAELIEIARQIPREVCSSRWITLIDLAAIRVYTLQGSPDRAMPIASALKASDSVEIETVTRALVLEYHAMVERAYGSFDSALDSIQRAIGLLDRTSVNSYEAFELRLRRAELHLDNRLFADALQEIQGVLEHSASTDQTLEAGHLRHIGALAALGVGQPTLGLKYFAEAEFHLRRVGDTYELGRLLIDKAECKLFDPENRVADAAEAFNIFERIDVDHLIEQARTALTIAQMDLRKSQSLQFADRVAADSKVIAASEQMKTLLKQAKTCAPNPGAVLILGETGVGKEVLAKFIHEHSDRSGEEFVAINCAAVPESLFEREFFGHSKGSFTGADRDRPGLVEQAEGGTLFLDEVGEMPLTLQPKLLRLLQEGTYRRVGETRERTAKLRIVAATNRGLREQVQDNTFREDLFYRLSWFELVIPPLRERKEDVVELAKFFLARESQVADITYWVQKDAWHAIRSFSWPGNVRQLEAAIGSACAWSGVSGCVRLDHLPPEVRRNAAPRRATGDDLHLATAIELRERELILEALRKADQHRTEAAKILGIGRNTLYEKMRRLGIKPERQAKG